MTGDDDSESGSEQPDSPDLATRARGVADDLADLPDRYRRIVLSGERLDRAIELLGEGYGERRTARKLADECGLETRRAQDYVMAAYAVMARCERRVNAEQRRAELAERARKTYRDALARKRAILLRSPSGDSVEYADEPDLRTAQSATEFEAKLYGVHEPAGEQRGVAAVLELARDLAEHHGPAAQALYGELVLAVAKAAGRSVEPSRLPSGSGVEGEDDER